MPITYIVGPICSSKSTLLESYRKEVPQGFTVVQVGSRGLPSRYFDRAEAGAISFFAEHPTHETMRSLSALAKKYPNVQIVVTIEDDGAFSKILSNASQPEEGYQPTGESVQRR